MSDKPSSHSRSRSYSSSHSNSSDKDSIGSSSRRHSHSRSDRSYSSSKSSHSYSRYSRSRSRDRSRGSSHGVGLPKIFITKLQPFVRQKDIEAEFGKYGRIRKTNLKRGFAFVEFYEKDDAREAIRKLNNKRLFGQQERIVVEEAIGNKRDRDRNRRRYSRSRDRFRDRPRYRDSRDRYYDDRDRYRYRKSDDYSRRRNRKTGPKSTDECYNCGGMGHWANECHMPRNSKKPYKSGHGDRSQYSSNSLDNKAKKQDYSDKKEKVINPTPNLEIKNSKSEPVKEQAEKAKDVEPPKPEEGNQ